MNTMIHVIIMAFVGHYGGEIFIEAPVRINYGPVIQAVQRNARMVRVDNCSVV